MKKTLCFILALSMCVSAFSCSDKKKDSEPKPEPTEEDTALEKPFFTLSEDEFTEITVNPTRSEDTPPVALGSFDVSSLDFGARVPICVKDHDYEEYHSDYGSTTDYDAYIASYYKSADELDPNYPYETSIDAETGNEVYYREVPNDYSDYVYEAQNGEVVSFSVEGDTVYLMVSFEPDSSGAVHEWAVFSYDIPTGKLDELYTHSSAEESEALVFSCFADGKYWYVNNNHDIYELRAADLEKKEDTLIYSSPNYFNLLNGDCLYIQEINYDDPEMTETTVYSVNTDTCEMSEFCSYTPDENASNYFSANGTGSYLSKAEDSRNLDIVTPDYRIGTGIRKGQPIYADENCFVIMQADGYYTTLHYYDIEKKVHYTVDTSGYGSIASYCNGGVIITSGSLYNTSVYYILPTLGLFFELEKNSASFTESITGGIASESDDNELKIENFSEFNTNKGQLSFAGISRNLIQLRKYSYNTVFLISRIYFQTDISEF